MAFTFYSLLEATLLCLNAVCILHEERFLAKSMSVNFLCGCRNAYKCERGVVIRPQNWRSACGSELSLATQTVDKPRDGCEFFQCFWCSRLPVKVTIKVNLDWISLIRWKWLSNDFCDFAGKCFSRVSNHEVCTRFELL